MNDEELLFDTTVFSNFARIAKLELLWKFSQKIFTTLYFEQTYPTFV